MSKTIIGQRKLTTLCISLILSFSLYSQAPLLVKDLRAGIGDSDPQELINVNGIIFFAANDGTYGRELWKSDGTAAGTVMLKDINTAGNSNPQRLINVNGTVFFVATNSANGSELWKSDGTTAGTVMVKDLFSGALNSNPDYLTEVNGTLFFSANDGVNGIELWKSDGSAGGTVMVKDIFPGAGSGQPSNMINYNGLLLFAGNDGVVGSELWKSNGTAAGTVLVKDIKAGGTGSNSLLKYLTYSNGMVFFQADDGVNSFELWKTDGSTAGTVLVLDINTGGTTSDPSFLTDVNGTLFFVATKSGLGAELWKSDGTSAGTVLVKDIRIGASGSTPQNLINVNGTLFLAATDGLFGVELWKSDGTAAGTVIVRDIKVGGASAGSMPDKMHNLNGIMFFQADDGINGIELWKSDGTLLGTTLVQDIRSGTSSSNPLSLISNDGILYFQADETSSGKELWRLNYCSSMSLAGTAGGSAVALIQSVNCQSQSYYQDKTCNLIGRIQPSGSNYVGGLVTYKVKIDASVQWYNGTPYVQRYYDIIPFFNASSATATVTLYFTQAEFDAFNINNGAFPDLPANPTDATGKSYLMITQYHGTSVTGLPGTYSGSAELINPADGNIVWNAVRSWWEVTFNVTGFSGFFVHTGMYVLPVTFINTGARNSDGFNTVSWTMSDQADIDHFIVERSIDGSRFIIASKSFAEETKTQYNFKELAPAAKKLYYRIKAVLKNGNVLYSRILIISNSGINTTLNTYPNPVRDKLNFEYTSGDNPVIDIFLVSLSGKTLYRDTRIVSAGAINTIDVHFLPAGNYTLRIIDNKTGIQLSNKFFVFR